MRTRSLAHVSDLHFGADPTVPATMTALVEALEAARVDHVVVTGDLTDRGRLAELSQFRKVFAPLLDAGRVTIVPGNHDRLGDDAASWMMSGGRVRVAQRPGLYLVRMDSTAPHNRWLIAGHGVITDEDVEAVCAALDAAPADRLVCLLMHHHPLPMPLETISEYVATAIGWPAPRELTHGRRLLDRIAGKCDLVLHGHRHVPRETLARHGERPLYIYNAGSASEMGRVRLFQHRQSVLMARPSWLAFAPSPAERAFVRRAPARDAESSHSTDAFAVAARQ